jgi:TonB family protein
MHRIVQMASLLLLATLAPVCSANDDPGPELKRALELSALTGPHAQPFHLKMTISEPSNPSSMYRATIEEFWQSPTLWQRSIDSPTFRQDVTVRGSDHVEQNDGDYYPVWLRGFVTAAIDPLEDAAFWNKLSARIVQTTTTNGRPSSSCARAQFKIGTPAVNNDAFAVICFNADGTLASVVRPGYEMEFQDSREFGRKRIACRYVNNPEPGTTLVGEIEILEEIKKAAPTTALPDLTGLSSNPIRSAQVSQEMFDQLVLGPADLKWPPVHSGNTTGKLSMYISADRDGHIREAYPLNSDNAGLQGAARDQLLKWQLKPAVNQGQHVQVEAALTFEFSTTLEGRSGSQTLVAPDSNVPPTIKPVVVSPGVVGALQIKSYAPVYPQDLRVGRISGKVQLQAIIGTNGQVVSLTPTSSTDPEFTKAAITAVQHWAYKPYLLNGSPVEIETVITVNFQAP